MRSTSASGSAPPAKSAGQRSAMPAGVERPRRRGSRARRPRRGSSASRSTTACPSERNCSGSRAAWRCRSPIGAEVTGGAFHRRACRLRRPWRTTYPIETERLLPAAVRRGRLRAAARHAVARRRRALALLGGARRRGGARGARGEDGEAALASDGDRISFAVVLKALGRADRRLQRSGRSAAQHRQGEIGFIFHPDHHGHGLRDRGGARAAARSRSRECGFHRVIGRLEARNAASARVLERLGMRREAHLVENEWVKGEWQSELVYAILEHEWRAQAGLSVSRARSRRSGRGRRSACGCRACPRRCRPSRG